VWREGTSLKVATTNSVTPWTLVVEKATDLSNPNWQQVLSTWTTMTDYILTVPIDSDKAFFRIAGQALVP
jgi:hypothetical protein